MFPKIDLLRSTTSGNTKLSRITKEQNPDKQLQDIQEEGLNPDQFDYCFFNVLKLVFIGLIFIIIHVINGFVPEPDPSYLKQDKWLGMCHIGKSQSPINITTADAILCPDDKKFFYDYQNAKVQIHSYGENLKTNYRKQAFIKYFKGQKQFDFYSDQFHWHSPSEHWINGKRFDMQLHIVHTSSPKYQSYGVVSILFTVDQTNSPDVFDTMDITKDSGTSRFDFPFDLKDRFFYHYKGSLTTPLCDQTIEWFVLKQPFLVSRRNLMKIKEKINDGQPNARYIQRRNGRSIEIVGDGCNNLQKILAQK